MAEKTILVCDVCGEPAGQRVTIRIGRRALVKDLCDPHLAELTDGTRLAKRGRPRAVGAAAGRRKSTPAASDRQTRGRKRPRKREQPAA
jgi:hypothetical protein